MKKALRKTISLVLCLAALLGMVVLPVPARAAGENDGYWQLARTEISPTQEEVNEWNKDHNNVYYPAISSGSMTATGTAFGSLHGEKFDSQKFSVGLSYSAPPERINPGSSQTITFTCRTEFENHDETKFSMGCNPTVLVSNQLAGRNPEAVQQQWSYSAETEGGSVSETESVTWTFTFGDRGSVGKDEANFVVRYSMGNMNAVADMKVTLVYEWHEEKKNDDLTGSYWQLVKTESYGNYRYQNEDSENGIDRITEKNTEPGKSTATGWQKGSGRRPDTTNTAVFSSTAPRDTYKPGETATITASIEAKREREQADDTIEISICSTFVTNPIGPGNVPEGNTFKGIQEREGVLFFQKVSADDEEEGYAETLLNHKVFDYFRNEGIGQQTVTGTFEAAIPEPNTKPDGYYELGTEMVIVVTYHDGISTRVDGYSIYRYEWVGDEKPPEEDVDRSFRVNGFVENAALEEMGGLSVKAELIDLKNPDFYSPAFAEETTRTDDMGMFYVTFAVPDEVEIPAVRVRVTLQYLDADMTPLLRFIDCWDSTSVEKEQMMIDTRVTLSADEIFQVDHGEIPTKYLGLSFANLLGANPAFAYGDDASDYQISLEDKITVIRAEKWGVDPDTGESVLIREEANLGTFTAEKRMADASLLYKTARDAHRFASEWLVNEADAMKASEIRIRLRDREATDWPSSWFRGDTMSIYLEAPDCVRDDNGIAVLLHEFGHAADFLTGNKEHHVSSYEGDENHGGIFNATMADSYTEGFATFFASMVKKYMSYPGDAKHLNAAMSFDTKAARSVYANNGTNEEIAIAAFLYSADAALGGIKKLWPVLDEKRGFFKDYYDAILDAASKSNAAKLESVAESMYLYTMPLAGNGKYDEGEPFNDKNNDWVRDPNEDYYDLPFTWTTDKETGKEITVYNDPAAWEKAKNSRTFGLVQDKKRADNNPRFAPANPDFGYLSLGGVEVEYVLVTVRPTGEEEEAFSELRRVWGGEVFLVDPRLYTGGTVSVSVPGGGSIYEASIDDLKEALRERGKDDYLALAYVTADQLAPVDVIAIPTFGDPDATGFIIKEAMTPEEITQWITEGGNTTGGVPSSSTGGEGYDPGKYDTSDNGGFLITILLVLLGGGLLFFLIRSSKKRKAAKAAKSVETPVSRVKIDSKKTRSAPTYDAAVRTASQISVCEHCGSPLKPGAKFCVGCGAPVPTFTQEKEQARFCRHCGASIGPNAKFCMKCGNKL